jgi:hypothetical protein
MAIPTEFTKYWNLQPKDRERVFQTEIIIPFLHRLGFRIAWDSHGNRENGRDMIFAGIDPFNDLLYFGMQVKFLETLSGGDSRELANDVVEAFRCPFKDNKRGVEGNISRFYILNGGNIADGVAERVRGEVIGRGIIAPNIRFIDGKELMTLCKWATYNRGFFVREQLTGLLLELMTNQRIMAASEKELDLYVNKSGPYPLIRYRLDALSAYLQRPFATDRIPVSEIETYWLLVTGLNHIMVSVDVSVYGQNYKTDRFKCYISLCANISKLTDQIVPHIIHLIGEYGDP